MYKATLSDSGGGDGESELLCCFSFRLNAPFPFFLAYS